MYYANNVPLLLHNDNTCTQMETGPTWWKCYNSHNTLVGYLRCCILQHCFGSHKSLHNRLTDRLGPYDEVPFLIHWELSTYIIVIFTYWSERKNTNRVVQLGWWFLRQFTHDGYWRLWIQILYEYRLYQRQFTIYNIMEFTDTPDLLTPKKISLEASPPDVLDITQVLASNRSLNDLL